MKARRRPTQAELLARLPRAFRPKLDTLQQRDLALYHNVNLDAIATGQAEASMLWDFLGGVLLWHRAAELMGMGVPLHMPTHVRAGAVPAPPDCQDRCLRVTRG